MSEVLFASAKVKKLSAEDTLPAKFKRLLQRVDLESYFNKRTVAIKMHVGGNIGYTTIHPLFVRILVEAIKGVGGKPFITDGSGSVSAATPRGYTEEVLGAPIRPAAGVTGKYYHTREINYRGLKEAQVCGDIADADAMLVLSHGKGHGVCGYGGAIKNIAMGCVTPTTRGHIHRLMDSEFTWNEEACEHCYICRDNCPAEAITFNEKGRFGLFSHNCRYCLHCVHSCPEHAITINTEAARYFQEGMARTVKVALDTFEAKRVLYITMLMDITPLCDCWGFSTLSLVPDVGIVASEDIVATEQSSLDMIDWRNYIPGSLPEQLQMGEEGHLFQRIWRKDPYLQVETAAELGLGSRKYKLVEIE